MKSSMQVAVTKAVAVGSFVALSVFALGGQATAEVDKSTESRVVASYDKLALSFEVNQGQTDKRVKFLSRSQGYTVFLTSTEAVLTLAKSGARKSAASYLSGPKPEDAENIETVLRMQLVGANPEPQVAGLEELPGKVNYFIGNDPTKWHANISTYAKVEYKDIYPGIDLIYYGRQRELEYDFLVARGADPKTITLAFEGSEGLQVDARGDLVMHTAQGEIRLHKPVVYQEMNGGRKEISGGYVLKDKHRVGFQVAAYDGSKSLIIDPVLSYSTYVGGSDTDEGTAVAVDSAGNAYVTGSTLSPNFPTARPLQAAKAGVVDAFVAKLDATGGTLLFSTYLGGAALDQGNAIALDGTGNTYVTGTTGSDDFPTTAGAFQIIFAGGINALDAFVTKLSAAGSSLVYSTYLGGNLGGGLDAGYGIAVDASGNAYVTGQSNSTNFPTTPGAYRPTFFSGAEAFVTKLTPDGSGLVYSTYLGGASFDAGNAIAIDSFGNAYVTGTTRSLDFPTTAGAFQRTFGGGGFPGGDAFVTKLNDTGSALVYSSYLGGSMSENLGDFTGSIAVDSAGNAYVTGSTASVDFPTARPLQAANAGGVDAFVTKITDVIQIAIDIKPDGFPNSINLGSGGTVPVAIFSTATFDATTVDPTAVTLAGAQAALKGKGTLMSSVEDVDGDGLLDLVIHVRTEALQLSDTDTEAVLEGKTFDGALIRGTDSVRVVP